MKKQKIILIGMIILVLLLIGCSGTTPIIPSVNQEEQIKEVVNGYWSALSNRQYSLAKSYCIKNGQFYNAVEEYQNMPYFGSTIRTWNPYINWVKITGNNATANVNITLTVTICFDDICSTESETIYNFPMDLIKLSGNWELK
jgi:hypothetical protein